jgi:hypothetical protein
MGGLCRASARESCGLGDRLPHDCSILSIPGSFCGVKRCRGSVSDGETSICCMRHTGWRPRAYKDLGSGVDRRLWVVAWDGPERVACTGEAVLPGPARSAEAVRLVRALGPQCAVPGAEPIQQLPHSHRLAAEPTPRWTSRARLRKSCLLPLINRPRPPDGRSML